MRENRELMELNHRAERTLILLIEGDEFTIDHSVVRQAGRTPLRRIQTVL
jgi:hypothetical protein